MARAYTGSGAPAAGTLPGGNVTFLAGDMYFDTTAKNLYVCNTAGSATTSVWTIWGTSSATPTIVIKTGSKSGTSYTTTSTTFADVDTTNLAYTVTIPTGQKLTVRILTGSIAIAATDSVIIGFFDSVAAAIVGGITSDQVGSNATTPMGGIGTVIVGDGVSHTVKLQWRVNGGTGTMSNDSSTSGVFGFVQIEYRLEAAN